MDRKLRRSGDGARIAGMLELDDLGILGGVDKNVFKIMTYMQTTPWPAQAEESTRGILVVGSGGRRLQTPKWPKQASCR